MDIIDQLHPGYIVGATFPGNACRFHQCKILNRTQIQAIERLQIGTLGNLKTIHGAIDAEVNTRRAITDVTIAARKRNGTVQDYDQKKDKVFKSVHVVHWIKDK
jgi:hypothetical protein